jgi:putative Holliday junction resolvase
LDEPIRKTRAIDDIRTYCVKYGVARIVLGYPIGLSGAHKNASTAKVEAFKKKLVDHTGLEVLLLDERFSSKIASKLLSNQGIAAKKQRQIIDNISAQILLQTYIDKQLN